MGHRMRGVWHRVCDVFSRMYIEQILPLKIVLKPPPSPQQGNQLKPVSIYEVLLPSFKLEKTGSNYKLFVDINEECRVIQTKQEREEQRCKMQKHKQYISNFKKDFKRFIEGQPTQPFCFDQSTFPNLTFRFVSGGTLPIIQQDGKNYFCMFYRDIFPIGWNIANGASDNYQELLRPDDTIERELREELLIINPEKPWKDKKGKGVRYYFPVEGLNAQDHPDFAAARRLWQKILTEYEFEKLTTEAINLEWFDGPDEVSVRISSQHRSGQASRCFVNINVEDFGIEIDRIIKINFNEGDIILDGEISNSSLLNRVVGLFEVEKIENESEKGKFMPDFCFHTGIKKVGSTEAKEEIDKFLLETKSIRTNQQISFYENQENKYDLCPVTRTLMKRYTEARRKKGG